MTLAQFFAENSKVAIAFSGGVDSAYLLSVAKKFAVDVQAYYVKSAFQPQFELDDAKKLADELNVKMTVLSLDVLSEEKIVANPSNRCYFCKQKIFTAIKTQALSDGFTVLLDGTNASDDVDDRPGMKALSELSVLSPLRICGLTKSEIRTLSKEAGLFTFDKPSYSCLATRIPTGMTITAQLLQRTEKAENYLFSLGFSNFRVRTVKDGAKLQFTENQLPLFIEKREEILKTLRADYQSVCLDLEVRSEN